MKRTWNSWIALVLLVAAALAINVWSFASLRSLRADLTENKIFTLTQGTHNVLGNIEEPITLRFYYSRKLATDAAPGLSTYVTTIQELLEEYRDASGGMLRLEIIDPEPFSEEEDDAAIAGLQSIPIGPQGEPMFLGLVGRNSVDDQEIISFFDPGKERFLEYDITRLIYKLSNPDPGVVGVISTLPVFGSQDPMARFTNPQAAQDPYIMMQQLEQIATVRDLGTDVADIPEDVDVLMVIHPKRLSDETLYAIDQYVLAGRNALIFVDPHADAERPPSDPQNPMNALWADKASDPGPLLEAWGIEMVPNRVAADRTLAQRVIAQTTRGTEEAVNFVAYLGVTPGQMNEEDVITAGLGNVNLATAGVLRPTQDSKATIEPLLSTTEDSMLLDVEKVKFAANPTELLQEFEAAGENLVLAARLSGEFNTAFPGGLDATAQEEETDEATEEETTANAGHLETSEGPVNVVVFADTDFLTDTFWVEVQPMFGIAIPRASNGDLVANAVENLSGSGDLISVRARGVRQRTFEVVEELEREANERYRAREKQLEDRLTELQEQINEIQFNRGEAGERSLILNDEQSRMIEQAQDELVETRLELREVQRALNSEIESLGTRIKFINIALIPLLISFYAAGLGLYRVWRRRA